jgi:short-subunit dehydrogenase
VSAALRDAVAVVSGASSGLGRRFAVDLARAGAVVVGIARRGELLEELAGTLLRSSPASGTEVCDVADTDAYAALLGRIEADRGRIDVLVQAAGIGEERGDDPTVAGVRRVMDVNFFGAVAGTLAVLPGMLERRSGIVVNVSSDSGRAPGPGEPGYGASKAALSAFTESMAMRHEGNGVHLHVLYPGWVPTAMGQGAVDEGMPMPPKMVRRSEDDVARLLLDKMGGAALDIDAAKVARLAPVARALFPGAYRRGVRKAAQA